LSVSVAITGDMVDAGAIERIVGFQGSAAWKRDDLVPGTKIKRRDDGWEFRTPFEPGYAIDEKINGLHNKLLQQSTALVQFCQDHGYRTSVVCIVEMYDETAGLVLSADLIAWMAQIGASLEIDTYISVPAGDPDEGLPDKP